MTEGQQVASIYASISADITQLKTAMDQMRSELDRAKAKVTDFSNVTRELLASVGVSLSIAGVISLEKQMIGFAMESYAMANAVTASRNALIATVGSADRYREAMTLAKEATHGMIGEAELATSVNVLLSTGLAANANEAANLVQAGNILTQVYASNGASVEKFIRLLASGNQMLLDNFGLTTTLVNAKKDEIEATSNLTGEEARMAAIKALVVSQAEKYSGVVSEGAQKTAALDAAVKDLKATIGEQLTPQLTPAIGGITNLVNIIGSMPEVIGAAIGAILAFNPVLKLTLDILNLVSMTGEGAIDVSGLDRAMSIGDRGSSQLNQLVTQQEKAADAQERLSAARRTLDNVVNNPAGRPLADILADEKKASDEARLAAEKYTSEIKAQEKARADLISSQVSYQLAPSTTMAGLNLPEGPYQDKPAENVRRIADFAFNEMSASVQENMGRLKAEMPKVYDEIFNSADPKATAKKVVDDFQKSLRPDLYNRETIKARVREWIVGQENLKALTAEITNELMGEGFSKEQIGTGLETAGMGTSEAGKSAAGNIGSAVITGMTDKNTAGGIIDTLTAGMSDKRNKSKFESLADAIARGVNDNLKNAMKSSAGIIIDTITAAVLAKINTQTVTSRP